MDYNGDLVVKKKLILLLFCVIVSSFLISFVSAQSNSTIFEESFEIDLSNFTTASWIKSGDQFHDGLNSAKLPAENSDQLTLTNALDLSDANEAYIDIWIRKDDTEPAEFYLAYYTTGTGWVNIIDLDTLGGDDSWLQYNQPISNAYWDNSFKFRIDSNPDKNEDVWVDQITIIKASGGITEFIRGVSQGVTVSSTNSRKYDGARATAQGISVGSITTRIYGAIRETSQSITASVSVLRIYEAKRSPNQGIGFTSTLVRLSTLIRGVTQSITADSDATRLYEAIREISQSITVESVVSRTYEAVRGVTQGISVNSLVSRLFDAKRGVAQGITVLSAVSRIFSGEGIDGITAYIRDVSQGITTSGSVSRTYSGLRFLSQGLDLYIITGLPPITGSTTTGYMPSLSLVLLAGVGVWFYMKDRQ